MDHDLCHCEGNNCDLRDMCKRYIAHKELGENAMRHVAYAKPRHAGKYCELFYRYHEEDSKIH